MFATKNIRKGETVFVERPVVSSQFLWNALYNYRGEWPVVVARPHHLPRRGDHRVPKELPGFQGKGLGLS